MSCNNIEDISVNMCNKICNDNIPASNTVQLTSCNTKCNQKITNELNPLDITNNFIFLNSADVAENALEIAGEQSQVLYEEKRDMMNSLITNMEREIQIKNAACGIRIGAKWKKIIDGDANNQFIDNDYMNIFKRYSAFGVKWKNVRNTKPDDTKYIEIVKSSTISDESYNYLNDALISGKDTQDNIILNKKALIDNKLFPNDDAGNLIIYPNSYIKLSDNSYCIVYTYPIIQNLKSIFNGRNDIINLTDSVEKADIFKNAFFDLTMDDFVINDSGDIYIPSIGCSDFENDECITIENLLSDNENCMVDNKDNDFIKRKDTIPYLFHDDAPSWCITNALKFDNKSELYDIINLITNDQFINHELNEMMGKYEADRYENIKTRINDILADEYSQYFSTNDFLNLFNNNIQYWITIDELLFKDRSYRYNRQNTTTGKEIGQPTGTYDVRNENITNNYDVIAKILSNYIPVFPSSNHLIQLQDSDVESIRTLFESETISKKRKIENILQVQDYFNIIDADGNSTKVILYTPLYEHSDNREAIYYDCHLNHDWSSKSGVDFYQHLNDGEKTINVNINGSYGQIGYGEGFYNNVILSDDYITKTECEAIKLNAENTSNTIFLNENIQNRHDLDKYRLNDIDFNNVTDELTQYNTNIENLNRCIENSKTMINLDTYTKTKEYDNINQNIRSNAEVNKKYNIYLPKVNKYDGLQTDCKFLSEYNNKDTCGISGETTQMCLSDDFISDTQYDTKLQSKKDSLKSYIFNRQKDYYVGKKTKTDEHYEWRITTDYPTIGLELVNANLTQLLDSKFITVTSIITLTDDDLSTNLTDDELLSIFDNIDNNTYVSSSVPGRYYIVNLQQEDCNQPNDYVLQNSETICGGDKQCAYENEYINSISEISQYDDNLCTNKYNYLEECYNQDPDFNMGKQVDYSVCRDDIQSSPQIIDCCPVRADGTPDPECAQNPDCGEGSYITYKIENGRYTCEKVCGSCVTNTTLNVSDSKCHANIGYYYDYDYDELESTNPPVPEQCQEGYFIDVTGAKTISECEQCIPECDADHYETVDCTFSTNRVCTPLPDNSTKNQNGIDFVCDENYFKRGDQCVACPNETTSVQGSTSVSQCIANEGHYFDPQSFADDETMSIPTDAQQCGARTYCASGATSETPCPNNTTSVAGSTDISQCYADPGFFYNNAIHSEGQSCLPGHYCPGGLGSTIQNACPANTYNSLSGQTDENACNLCEYETTSEEGSAACTDCPAIPTFAADRSAIRQYRYYNYQQDGCRLSIGTCSDQQLSTEEGELNDADCPTTTEVTDENGRTIIKNQFYGYTGVVQRDATSGKPILFQPPENPTESQEDLTRKLRVYDDDMGGYEYLLGDQVDLKCEKTCMTCFPNEKFVPNLSACDPCEDNKVAGPDGLNCIPCHERDANTIYDAELGDCTLCNPYQLPNFESNVCENPEPGYYVVCDAHACVQTKADTNKIVFGQINKVDWVENIKSIIFDYELLQIPEAITNNIDIIFRNESWSKDKILNLPKKTTITDNKYYKDISTNIIIFENATPTDSNFLIKFMESIYISNSTTVDTLPNKLILQTENDSYYLLTHKMQQDISDRYSTADIWDDSYLIFDMYLNITNEQYLCPDNTYIDNGTAIEASGSSRGTNRNICKFYDSGYYRDIYTSTSGADSSSLSDASTTEDVSSEEFTNYENFESRIQTTCLKDFTLANIATIDISESILGAQSGGDYAGCVYKCNTAGHYYNQGTPGKADNKCQPCPIGYKCENLQTRTACDSDKYQNVTGQTACKTIPTGGVPIFDSERLAHIGFSVPAGKKYNDVSNTITNCSENTYKNTQSVINNLETEREIICDNCPPNNTTTKGVEGSTELAQCIPNFGYTLDTSDGVVTTLAGYDDSTGSIQCASGYYLGDCDILNPNRNECTECLDENDKACIPCPTGYTCAGGSVDCKATPAIPLIKPANIDDDPLTAPIYTIDACWPGMKLTSEGECQVCQYTGAETDKYCFDGTLRDHISPSVDDIKLKNNDNFTPAIYITAADNLNYNINSITQDSGVPNDIVFSFKNNYIPANIDSYFAQDIDLLKDNDVPLYLYEHASGEKNANQILNAKNVTQEAGVSINGNTIDLLNEGYISNKDASNIIKNKIISNNLKFTGDEKNELLDIIMSYKNDRLTTVISDDLNLSYIYELEYYDGTQYKIQSYVYRILPYPSLCGQGTHTLTGLIGSCEACPIGTYKTDTSATSCQKAEGNYYVGVNNQSVSAPAGLGGISVSEMPTSPGFEMLTTADGGNYGYKLKTGYGYTAPIGENPFDNSACLTGFNEEQILINNTMDNTDRDYLCSSCPSVTSYTVAEQTGLLRVETNSPTASDSTACVIKVCDANYTNIGGVTTNFCELEKCPVGYYFNETSNSCEVCPEGHYCNGNPEITPTASTHPKIECPTDTYNPTTGIAAQSKCEGCPTHTSTDGVVGSTSIANCISNAGYYFDSTTGSKATICPPGKYCPKDTTGPKESLPSCPTHTTSPEGSSSYSHCRAVAGWFYPHGSHDTDENTVATACPEDTYCVGDNESAVGCPLNTNTGGVGQKTQKSDCVADPGYYYNVTDASHINAQACPAGTYNPDHNSTDIDSCRKCPQNTYSANKASIKSNNCLDCPNFSSTTYDDAGNPVEAGIETTGKTQLADCKPAKMYKTNLLNIDRDPENEIELKPGHNLIGEVYGCYEGFYFNVKKGECETCPIGHYCPGGLAAASTSTDDSATTEHFTNYENFDSSDGAIKEKCPQYSTSPAGSTVIDNCVAIPGYKEVGTTNVFEENEGVAVDGVGDVKFKENGTVQCIPGYEAKPDSTQECQSCALERTFSTDGNGCSVCGTSDGTQLVIKECDLVMDIIKIDKSILRIHSLNIDDIITVLQNAGTLTVGNLFSATYITPQANSYPNYKFFDTTSDDLYFIKLPTTYSELPVSENAETNIHSNVTDSEIIDNVIKISSIATSSYAKIMTFINNTITDQTDILDLCYFPYNGQVWEVFLLLPKCVCIPGTFGNECNQCPTEAGRQTFQPGYNQATCIPVPTTIQDDSYTIIQDSTSIYNIGVNLNAGWTMDSSGASSKCDEDTYNAYSTDITNQIVSGVYTAIDCTNCPDGSGTQNRDPVNGATNITDCDAKFGYMETAAGTDDTLPTYGYDTGSGYGDVDDPPDGTIDCLAGYYFDETSATCMECPAGYYCLGGVAANGGAVATPCPIGTYNTNTTSIDLNACKLIDKDDDGRGRYGTMLGIDNRDHNSFKMCTENTTINKESSTRKVDDCEADSKWEKIDSVDSHTGENTYIVALKPQYYEVTDTKEIKCRPGTVSVDGTGTGLCKVPTSFNYNQDYNLADTKGTYLSGLSKAQQTCNTTPANYMELSQCDAFKNSISEEVPNFKRITGGGTRVLQCNLGYYPMYLDAYEDTNAQSAVTFIDAQNEFYLYEYDAKIKEDLVSGHEYLNDHNYHLNKNNDVKNRLEKIINNNTLKIEGDDLYAFKDWVKKYTVKKQENDEYKLRFFKDVNVYNNDRVADPTATKRYIYEILPICDTCLPGYTSTGLFAEDPCVACPAGSKQGPHSNGKDKICIACEDGTYQDTEHATQCKSLPSTRDGYTPVYNTADEIRGRMDFNINTGYKWIDDENENNVVACPRNTITLDYTAAGRIKTNATACDACPENQYQATNKYQCTSCPNVGSNPGTAYYYNTDNQECTLCGTDSYFDGTSAEKGKGILKWQLKTAIPAGSLTNEYEYCGAAPDGCDGPVYTYDDANHMCKLNQCPAGQFFNGTACEVCPAGYFCPSVATQIQETSPGVWEPAKTACEEGKYQQNTGSTSCVDCPDNTWHTSTGISNVNQCVANKGYYGPAGGPATPCAPGKYNDTTGSADCSPCPLNTSHTLTARTNANDCVANPGYTGVDGAAATACVEGTYKDTIGSADCSPCPDNTWHTSTGISNVNECVANPGYYGIGNSIQQCTAGSYCPGGPLTPQKCPGMQQGMTTSPAGSSEIGHCTALAGSYGSGNSYSPCPDNTTSSNGAISVNDCTANSGYYGKGNSITACPGFSAAAPNNIRTDGDRLALTDCIYESCGAGNFRNSSGQCVPFNNLDVDDCTVDKIFIAGNQIGTGTRYSAYGADIVSNYASTNHIYGHDNTCLNISEICT